MPLAAAYNMEPDASDAKKLVDAGPLGINGHLGEGVVYIAGGHDGKGHALQFSGAGENIARVDDPKLIQRLGSPITFTVWVRPDALGPLHGMAPIVAKRSADWMAGPFDFGIGDNGGVVIDAFNGRDWNGNAYTGPMVKVGEWVHLAFTHAPNGDRVIYVNGKAIDTRHVDGNLAANDEPLQFGRKGDMRFKGLMEAAHFYAAALTPAQIQEDLNGTLQTRAAVAADIAPSTQYASLRLARWDMPRGFSEHYAPTRQTAQRKDGPDAVDWPTLTLRVSDTESRPLWTKDGDDGQFFPLRDEPQRTPIFQQPYDHVIQPGNHWLRALKWTMWGQRYVYTTDNTARSWGSEYELWTFPVKITGAGPGDVKNVALSVDGKTIYTNAGPLHSLTLLLPQNEAGHPYQLSVAGRPAVTFNAGLEPMVSGDPVYRQMAVNLTVPGSPKITVASLPHSDTFPNPKEWAEDMASLGKDLPAPVAPVRTVANIAQHVGVDVPRSPETVYAMSLTHGMSGGFKYHSEQGPGFPNGSVDEYARFVADQGYDRVFEQSGNAVLANAQDPNSYEHWMLALAQNGIQAGLNDVALADANLTFYSANLPDYHAPKYRDAQLLAQRFARFPNFVGLTIGADNAAYVPYWDWAAPIPNRPWGEAFTAFQGTRPLKAPVSPLSKSGKTYEYVAPKQSEFLDYLARYDKDFEQYGYFARAVQEVDPKLVLTTGSFGSSPGVGGSGGYPWASPPGKPMFTGLPVLQTYDWNEQGSSKPMHNAALMDRLKSYFPDKPGWALLDDFHLFFGREPMQRAYALALTRGVQGVGTNFLANPDNIKAFSAAPDFLDAQRELFSWVHKYGGVYAQTAPLPTIGILFSHPQAESRGSGYVVHGDHEGMTTEALFLCHAAGWPAKIITPEEVRRGLPPSMKAILLVGLPRIDDSWHWYDGLAPQLQAFVQHGGRILTDDESVSPLPATQTNMQIMSYVTNRDMDWTPELIARNLVNIQKLQAAMQGIPPPFTASSDPTVWAVPTIAGDTQYVTIVNQAVPDGRNASRVIKPQTGTLAWNTSRPIYDVRLGRKITSAEAKTVDLTKDGFQFYALPPAPVVAPKVAVTPNADGFYRAIVTIANPQPMRGIPVQITVTQGSQTATVYSATGLVAKLPLAVNDRAGTYTVTATELLSGLSGQSSVSVPGRTSVKSTSDVSALARFVARKSIPLTIALTPEQMADGETQLAAKMLAAYYKKQGRKAQILLIEPNRVVLSLQPLAAAQPFPRWKTIDSDLILFGLPSNNILLLDEARGSLLPDAQSLPPDRGLVAVTYSPFVGERNVVNILARDPAGMRDAVSHLTQGH